MAGGNPVQKIAPPEPLQVSMIDVQSFPEAEREQEAARLALADANQPFDLGKAPLIRATLLKLAPEKHILLLNIHHIASDEWSLGVFVKELSALYKAFLQGRPSPLPQLPFQYADYAVWQRDWLQGEVLQSQLDYCKEKLKGSLPVLELPSDRPRPNIQTHNGSTVSLLLSRELTERLNALSRREGVTLFITLMAGFQVLLQRYTGQEDLLVGTPVANRNRPEIEGLIGFFVNTLVLRNDLSKDPTFLELMKRVQDAALSAYAHQDLPFEKLVQELNPDRDLSRSPILQVLFSFLNTPMQPIDLPGLEAMQVKADSGASKYDLSLYALEFPGGIACLFEYNTDLFDAERMSRMLGHLQAVLEGAVRDPGQRLSELPVLTEGERRQLLVEWNETQTDFPRDKTLHELLEAQAQRTPEAVAVECKGSRLSYRELNERADQLARYLKRLGVGPDVLVGLFHERSVDMMVALFGILKAGGAYVPLDPSFPEDRLSYMVENSGMRVLITHSALDGRLSQRPESVVRLDSDWKEISKLSKDRLTGPKANPNNLAYVLYTSGSTGKPKGVEIEHSAIVNLLVSMQRAPGFTANDTLLAVTTLSFDIAALELYLPLICGGRVSIASWEDARDPARLMQRMQESRCTVMQATPTTWRALMNAGWSGSPKLKVLCGGEGFLPDFAEQLRSQCGELWNMYGPTETTVWSTIDRIDSMDGFISIGRPIANTDVFVLDANRNLVPVGVAGELYIGGAGVARGYLNRAELTAERFVASPFKANQRLYRTGDLARWLSDGRLECLGRVDHQVKIRGYRIELEEIEAILSRYPAIRQCVVVASEGSSGEKSLVAYYVPQTAAQPAVSDLREHLKNKLPDYMIPGAWVALPALPLTPNGKVDRKALPGPEQQRPAESRGYLAPRTETEKTLARIWEEVVEVRGVGVHDNFFELGGHSLRAVNLIGEVERAFGIRFPLIALFHTPTIAQFAEMVDKERSSRAESGKDADSGTIVEEIRSFIVENYLGGQASGLKNSDSFLENEIIDPMRLYELVDFLHEAYGINMDEDSLTGNYLNSIDDVARFVQQSLKSNAGAEGPPLADDFVVENQ
jgi:amino acid adenylation domain-containing protein